MELTQYTWDIKLHDKNGLKYYTIKNVFNENEIKGFYEMFYILRPHLLPPELSGSAFDNNIKPVKKNSAIFTNQITPYPDIFSDFEKKFGFHRNIFTNLLGKNNQDSVYSLLPGNINSHNSLISYYNKNNDNYKPHFDNSIMTCLIWMNEKNRNYSGGDLHFPDYDITIQSDENTGILFPSCVKHEVTNIRITNPLKNKGRITYTTFFGNDLFYNPEYDENIKINRRYINW